MKSPRKYEDAESDERIDRQLAVVPASASDSGGRRRRTATLWAVLAVVVAVAASASLLLVRPVPARIPAPILVGHPAATTSSTSATFVFASRSGAVTSFFCRLDAGSLLSCNAAPAVPQGFPHEASIQYGNLTDGRHCFSVHATDRTGLASAPTRYCWTIASSGPGSAVPGVPGSRLGLGSSIRISGGSTFSTEVDTALGTRFVILVTDGQGRPVGGVPVTFSASGAPAAQAATKPPLGDAVVLLAAVRPAPRAVILAAATPSDVGTFAPCPGGNPTPWQCIAISDGQGQAISSTYTAGSSPGTYTVTATAIVNGQPVTVAFQVTVTPPAPPVTTTVPPAPPASPFTVSGDLTTPLFPGTSQALDLVITNPYASPITVAAGSIGISVSTGQTGCPTSGNFSVSQGLGANVTVPAGSTRSLSDLSVPQAEWPVITMADAGTNQDACQGAPITISYSGSATG